MPWLMQFGAPFHMSCLARRAIWEAARRQSEAVGRAAAVGRAPPSGGVLPCPAHFPGLARTAATSPSLASPTPSSGLGLARESGTRSSEGAASLQRGAAAAEPSADCRGGLLPGSRAVTCGRGHLRGFSASRAEILPPKQAQTGVQTPMQTQAQAQAGAPAEQQQAQPGGAPASGGADGSSEEGALRNHGPDELHYFHRPETPSSVSVKAEPTQLLMKEYLLPVTAYHIGEQVPYLHRDKGPPGGGGYSELIPHQSATAVL